MCWCVPSDKAVLLSLLFSSGHHGKCLPRCSQLKLMFKPTYVIFSKLTSVLNVVVAVMTSVLTLQITFAMVFYRVDLPSPHSHVFALRCCLAGTSGGKNMCFTFPCCCFPKSDKASADFIHLLCVLIRQPHICAVVLR